MFDKQEVLYHSCDSCGSRKQIVPTPSSSQFSICRSCNAKELYVPPANPSPALHIKPNSKQPVIDPKGIANNLIASIIYGVVLLILSGAITFCVATRTIYNQIPAAIEEALTNAFEKAETLPASDNEDDSLADDKDETPTNSSESTEE